MSDRISDAKLDHLIRIQDMLRCQMAHVLASDDGFAEGNVHAGTYRALVELKELRAERDLIVIRAENAERALERVEARLAEAEGFRKDAQCYHHLVGLIRANRMALAGEVLDWFLTLPDQPPGVVCLCGTGDDHVFNPACPHPRHK